MEKYAADYKSCIDRNISAARGTDIESRFGVDYREIVLRGQITQNPRSETVAVTPDDTGLDILRKSPLPLCPSANSWGNVAYRELCKGEIFGPGYVYRGEFRNHKFDGQGAIEYQNGEMYVGQFKEDSYDGYGVLYGKNRQVLARGVWRTNSFVGSTNSGVAPNATFSTPSSKNTVVGALPRVSEQSRPPLSLSANILGADSSGVVTLNITTNIDTVSLKVNGDEEGGRADGRYVVKRFAAIGENKFEIVAMDRFGNSQKQIVLFVRTFAETVARLPPLNPTQLRTAKPRDAVALIIGVEKYRRAPSADFAARDAGLFVDYAQRALGIRPENIKLLADDKAESSEILLALRGWLPTRVNRDKTDVFVFYSGHGLPSPDGESLYLLPYDVNRDLLDRTAISQKEVVDLIAKSNPRSATLFLDACYSGQTRTGETLLASARPISIVAKKSSVPKNFTIFSASAPDQISSSNPEVRHGIFSYFLMRGFEGEADSNRDGQISVAEMQAFLSEQVPRQALGQNRIQQPQVIGDTSKVLVTR